VTEAIQVSASLSDAKTHHRLLGGLKGVLNKFGFHCGLIITLNGAEEFDHLGRAVTVIPLYRWLLLE